MTVIVGSLLLSAGIEVGCFAHVTELCQKGANLGDILAQVVAVIALMLGTRRPPDPPPPDDPAANLGDK